MSGMIVGVAGYMGSGKTTFCNMLAKFCPCTIYHGDKEAKQLMAEDPGIKDELLHTFGENVVADSGINFKLLGQIAFTNLENLHNLNRIVHPVLLASLEKTIFTYRTGCLIIDAALLPMWKKESWFDKCIWIHASQAVRFDRISAKGSLQTQEISRRMLLQEALFASPDGSGWVTFANDTTIDEFEKTAVQFASAIRLPVDRMEMR